MLFSVGFLIFVRSNFDLLIDEFSSPCFIHGSRFIYLRINLIIFVGRATLNALSYTLLQTLDSGKPPISLFLDLSKTFDTVDNTILTIWHFGDYPIDRQQFVQYKGYMSNKLPIVRACRRGQY